MTINTTLWRFSLTAYHANEQNPPIRRDNLDAADARLLRDRLNYEGYTVYLRANCPVTAAELDAAARENSGECRDS